jgi:hypothetical protein
MEDLKNHKLIGYSSERLYSSVNPDWYLEEDETPHKSRAFLKINSTLGQFEALNSGLGILGISKEFPLLKHADIVRVLPQEKERVFHVSFSKREDENITTLEKKIFIFLKEKFKNYDNIS